MQIRRLVMVLITGAATLTAPRAHADDDALTSGTLEFSGLYAFNRSTFEPAGGGPSSSQTHLSAAAGVGRWMSDRFELTSALRVQHRSFAGEGQNGFGGSVGGVFNFARQGNLVPFVSAEAGMLSYFSGGTSDKAMLLPIVRAGFRSMIGEGRSLNVSLGYLHESNPKSTVQGTVETFDAGIGISLFKPR